MVYLVDRLAGARVTSAVTTKSNKPVWFRPISCNLPLEARKWNLKPTF